MRKTTLLAALAAALTIGSAVAQTTLLNVSYAPTRELYKDFNAASRVILRMMNSSHLKSR